ncbi:RTA1 like protein-domain-containing protein [Schizophyllum amplum]|uniref:RTA1 like protein-domain-containing protein n=1 Tax=Schizophyllum amplum TaxID=97359 RepID=A0A550CSJ3_9AGAR|nr:RTA1 like protein-domain-containing protein [Auriculariopsis ampla]
MAPLPSPIHRFLLTWTAFLLLASQAEARDIPCPDPFTDPKNDYCNPLRYIPTTALTAVSFSLILVVGIIQVLSMWRYGAKWMLAMTIGCFTFALGLALRFGLHDDPQSTGIYIVFYLFTVLSPCAFIAADYVLLGRIARAIGCGQYLAISPRRITVVFVSSDITTFLIQAAGGGLSTSGKNNPELALTGSRVFLAGLALQLLSFVIFTIIYALFLYRVYRFRPTAWTQDKGMPWYKNWLSLAGALVLSCIGILIRSVYRTIELSEGFNGPLATNEALFYGLDTLPLFIAIAIYIPFWPGRYGLDAAAAARDMSETTMTDNNQEKKTSQEAAQ